jgi:hypothetical protein
MRKLTWCIWLLFLPAAQTCWAQQLNFDSLVEVTKTAPEDTNKINLYWKAGAAVIKIIQ